MVHWDSYDIVSGFYCFLGQAISFVAHDEGEAFLLFQFGVVDGDAVLAQSHGNRPETIPVHGFGDGVGRHCGPWDKEHAAHADAYGAAVERIT